MSHDLNVNVMLQEKEKIHDHKVTLYHYNVLYFGNEFLQYWL